MVHLDALQKARADALVHARYVVGRGNDGDVYAADVHALATFILDGVDPWTSVRPAGELVPEPACGDPNPDGGRATCCLPYGHDDHVYEPDGQVLTLHRLDGGADRVEVPDESDDGGDRE